MSVSITYQNSNSNSDSRGPHLHPGSIIKGSVHFVSKSDTAISKATITFSGRCKVKIREHLHYTTRTFRSRGYYFYFTEEVFDGGGFTRKAGEYTWPFEFRVPETARTQDEVDVPRVGGVKGRRVLDHNGIMKVVEGEDEGGRGRYDDFPFRRPWRGSRDLRVHRLPDSFRCSGSGRSVDWEGRVEYALIARVERPVSGSKLFAALGKAQDLEAVADVTMKSGFDEASMSMSMLKERQMIEFERYVGGDSKSRGGFAKVLSKVVKSKTGADPDSTIQESGQRILFTVEVAKAVQPESTVPFVVKTKFLTSSNTSNPEPLVTDLRVCLLRKVSVRDDSRAATEHDAVSLSSYGLCTGPLESHIRMRLTPLPHEDSQQDTSDMRTFVGQADLTDLIRISGYNEVMPSFATYNIAVEWSLEFEVKIRFLGEVFSIGSSSPFPKIVVLPASSDVGRGSVEEAKQDEKKALSKKDEAAAEGESVRATERVEETEEQLPAYEP